jgi:hypothetical protein
MHKAFMRRFRINRICLAVALPAFILSLVYLVCALAGLVPNLPVAVLAAVLGTALLGASVFVVRTDLHCLACQQLFYGSTDEYGPVGWNIFASRCVHCGHPAREHQRDA